MAEQRTIRISIAQTLSKMMGRASHVIVESLSALLLILSRFATWLKRLAFGIALAPYRILGRIAHSWRTLAIAATGISEERLAEEGTPEERNRFLYLGSVVIVTACWAMIGACFFFTEMFQPRLPRSDGTELWNWYHWLLAATVPSLGLLWGVMIFNIDRVFLSSMLGQRGLERYASGVIRLVLAALLGYVISHPLKILFFTDTIAQYDEYLYQQKRDELYSARDKIYDKLKDEDATLNQQISILQETSIPEKINTAREQLAKAKHLELRELPDRRSEIIALYPPNGWIDDLKIPLSNIQAEPEPIGTARLIGRIGCNVDDVLEHEFTDNWFGNREAIDDAWRLSLVSEYLKYNVNPSSVLQIDAQGGEGTGNIAFKISSCSLGRILQRLWDERLNSLRAINVDATVAAERLEGLERNRNSLLEELERSEVDRRSSDDVARRIIGEGYAYQSTLLARLSNPESVEQDILRDPKCGDYAFCNREQRVANSWISWAIAAIFIFVEMAPVLAKMFMQSGPYERSLAQRHSEKGEESTDERSRRRAYHADAREAELAHANAIRSQALALKVGAERKIADAAARAFDAAENHAERHAALDESAALLEKVRKLSLDMYQSANDDARSFNGPSAVEHGPTDDKLSGQELVTRDLNEQA